MASPGARGDGARVAVDRLGPGAEAQFDVGVAGVGVAGQGQRGAVPGADVGRQSDAVVGGLRLLGEHDDAPVASVSRERSASTKRCPTMPWPTTTTVRWSVDADSGDVVVADIRRLLLTGRRSPGRALLLRSGAVRSGTRPLWAVAGRYGIREVGCRLSGGRLVGSDERSHEQRPSTAPLQTRTRWWHGSARPRPATCRPRTGRRRRWRALVTVLQRQITAVPGISARLTVSGAARG